MGVDQISSSTTYWATCKGYQQRISALEALLDHHLRMGMNSILSYPLKIYTHANGHQSLIRIQLAEQELPLDLTKWWTDHLIVNFTEYSDIWQGPLIRQLLVEQDTLSDMSIWTHANVLKSGILIEVRGDYFSLIDMETWLSDQVLHKNTHNLLEYQWSELENNWVLQVLVRPKGREVFKPLIHQIYITDDVVSTVYWPLTSGEYIWASLQSNLILSPHLKASTQVFLQGSEEDWLLVDESQVRSIKMRDLLSPNTWIRRFTDRFKGSPQCLTTKEPPISQWTIHPQWISKNNQDRKPQGILFKKEEHARALTRSLIDQVGLQPTLSISIFLLDNIGPYHLAWMIHEVAIFDMIFVHLDRLDLSSQDYIEMGPYTTSLYSAYQQAKSIWLPTRKTLSPLPPEIAFLPWFNAESTPSPYQMLWLVFDHNHNMITYQLEADKALLLHDVIEIEIEQALGTVVTPLDLLDEVNISLDLSDIRSEQDQQGPHIQKPVQQQSIKEIASLLDDQSQADVDVVDHPVEVSVDQEHEVKQLRDELRKVSLPKPKPATPKESAQGWLKSLSINLPKILSTDLAVDEWLIFANQLWLSENYEKSLDALCWALVEDELERKDDQELQQLLGWKNRLARPLKEEDFYLKHLRLCLYAVATQHTYVAEKKEEAEYLVQLLQTNPSLRLNQAWLICKVCFEDDLLRQRIKEWCNHCLALGLGEQHCDEYLQTVLIKHTYSDVEQLVSCEESQSDIQNNQIEDEFAPFEVLKAWGIGLIEAYLKEKKDFSVHLKTELLIVDQILISMLGVKYLLLTQDCENLPVMNILSDRQTQLLLTRYTARKSQNSSQILARLRTDPCFNFWKQHSTLNQREIAATPLGASLNALSSDGQTLQNQSTQSRLIEVEQLHLPLNQLIASLRPRIRSYLSFTSLVRSEIDEAFARFDKDWLGTIFYSLSAWLSELEKSSTVPYKVLTQLDLERIRVGYVVAQDEISQQSVEAWVEKWLLTPKKPLSWRNKVSFVSDFATQGVESLLNYLPKKRINILVHKVLKVFDQGYGDDPFAMQFSTQSVLNLEKTALRLLLIQRSVQLVPPLSETQHIEMIEGAVDHLFSAILDWIKEVEHNEQSSLLQGMARFKPPLTAWLYQVQYYDHHSLRILSHFWISKLKTLSIKQQARFWFILEDAFLSTPLHKDIRRPQLELWLRGRERVLREAWQLL